MLKTPNDLAVDACLLTLEQLSVLEQAIDTAAHAFVQRCRDERKDRRAIIASQLREGGRPEYSPFVLTYRLNRGYIELSWGELTYRRGSTKPFLKRVPMTSGGTHFTRILTGAHPDEADLIRSHEVQARAFRKLWSTYVQARRELAKVKTAVDQVAALETDPMVVASR